MQHQLRPPVNAKPVLRSLLRRTAVAHGRRKRGALAPECRKFQQKGCFLSFEWEKTNFTTFGFPWKKPLYLPGNNPSDAHVIVVISWRRTTVTVNTDEKALRPPDLSASGRFKACLILTCS